MSQQTGIRRPHRRVRPHRYSMAVSSVKTFPWANPDLIHPTTAGGL
jgi:hypothetical protein